jgi:hypothetical protein
MKNFDVLLDPGADKALGSKLKKALILESNDFKLSIRLVFISDDVMTTKFTNFLLDSDCDINEKDNVYFTPNQKNTNFKISSILSNLNCKKKNSVNTASVVVINDQVIDDLRTTSYLGTSAFYKLEKQYSYLLNPEFVQFVHNPHQITFADIRSNDYEILVARPESWDFIRMLKARYLNITPKDLLSIDPSITPIDLSGGIYGLTDYMFDTVAKEYTLISSALVNLVYTAVVNKKRVISEKRFIKKYDTSATILTRETVDTLSAMINSNQVEDRKLGLLLLSDSDYEEKPYYFWLIVTKIRQDPFTRYSETALLQIKQIRTFAENSRFKYLIHEKSRPDIFLDDMSKKGINPFLTQEDKLEFEKILIRFISEKLGSSIARLSENSILTLNYSMNLNY